MVSQLMSMGIHYVPTITTRSFDDRYAYKRRLYKTVKPDEFAAEKFTSQVTLPKVEFDFLGSHICAENLEGYEIHSGVTKNLGDRKIITAENIFGSYVHGIFDNDKFRRQILNAIRRRKNLPPLESVRNLQAEKQNNYERLAKVVRENLKLDLLNKNL